MALGLNEIKKRAFEFSKKWENEVNEKAEAKSFWDDFFNVFGISRRRIASFEEPVKKLGDKRGYIDLFWKGTLVVEHKSKGENLDKAYNQALDYFEGIKEYELPKYVLVSDFENFRLYDLESSKIHNFKLKEFPNKINLFGFISGYKKKEYKDEDPVNIKAAELMGRLHDVLAMNGYTGHELEVFLVRILFCLFSDDTGIFEKGVFVQFIESKTREDGTDVGNQLSALFQILNTPYEQRYKNLDEELAQFPYVNGGLFHETLPMPSFDGELKEMLLRCCHFDWGSISPAIFGSLFQSVMDQSKRRNLGAHYTSEKNILKLIKPLFLDELHEEFNKVKGNRKLLQEFHKKLASLKFLDPACGCGNFLVITYRELRALEIQVLELLYDQSLLDIRFAALVDVDQMHGCEIEEFPARIAEVALWLMDHQMNLKLSEKFGQYYIRLPLKKSAKIHLGNALKVDWGTILNSVEASYVLGNPPFVGSTLMNSEQREDMKAVSKGISGYGVLDYVTAWYFKAADYIENTKIKVGFVSTNSISQGEQVGILWNYLYSKKHIKINFAHQTFKWNSEARGSANVFVIIIGFSNDETQKKLLYEYAEVTSEPLEKQVKNINPYLIEGNDLVILNRKSPLSNVPKMRFGNMPRDNGNLVLTTLEKNELIIKEPSSQKFIKPYIGSYEFINNVERWCIWLVDATPDDLQSMPEVLKRIEAVRNFRLLSKAESTRKFAEIPYLFCQIAQPKTNYLLIPRISSERRKYTPIGFMTPDVIASDQVFTVENADLYLFGILTSEMHMAWMRYVCGRLKSDYRYSRDIVYNNYPFPQKVSKKAIEAVESKAKGVLEIREKYSDTSLASIYDPLTMPTDLRNAHNDLDMAVELCYSQRKFKNSLDRVEFLFALYESQLGK